MPIRRSALVVVLVVAGLFAALPAQEKPPISPSLFAGMKWRSIGPHRASRTVAAAGHRAQPHTFYMAAVNGGVWKTTDAGRTWVPIFDDQPTGSIGSLAVAPSDPERRLRRQRRGAAPARPVDGRRHLQVHRRRQDLDAPRPARRAADPAHRRRPAQRQPPVRGRARPSVRPQRGARHLPLDRRRPHVPEGALQGREHGRQRRRHRPGQPRHRLRHDVGRAAGPVGERGVGGHGRRHLQVDRRRDDVEAADQRAAGGRAGEPRHLACSNPKRLYAAVAFAERAGQRARTAARRASSAATTRARRGRASRPTRGRPAGSAAAICRCRSPTRRTPTGSSWPAPCRGSRPTAARPGRRSRARRAARTTRTAGSTRTTPTSCCWRPTRAPSSRSTAARRGVPGTTSRRRSCTTSPPTTRSRTASAAGSRRAARRASRAAATTGRSPIATGCRSASTSTATSRPTRSTRTSSTAAAA